MTTYFYSVSTSGFYTPDVHSTMPDDVVEITEEYYNSLQQGQSTGLQIAGDAQGKPVLVARAIITQTYSELRKAAYPSFADQFDTIFHSGLDAWKAEIQAVKNAFPKDTV
jgi:hypothetical protein